MSNLDKLRLVKDTFTAYVNTKQEKQEFKLPPQIIDIQPEGSDDVVGVRLVFAIEPTIQFVYVPNEEPFVAAFVFPGDDSAISVSLTLELAHALRSAVPDINVQVVSAIAPVFREEGVNFTTDIDEVYEEYERMIKARATYILERDSIKLNGDIEDAVITSGN